MVSSIVPGAQGARALAIDTHLTRATEPRSVRARGESVEVGGGGWATTYEAQATQQVRDPYRNDEPRLGDGMQVEEIIAKARVASGLEDIGDVAALEGLTVLVKSINEEAFLTQRGALGVEGMLVEMLANRMRIIDHLKQHPELLERPVDRPLFVFGPPRTGTTLTINLLNGDPARRCMLRWEAYEPAPPSKAGELLADPRFWAEQEKVLMLAKVAPQIAAAHCEEAGSPTECQYPMALSFCAQLFDSQLRVPSYGEWFMNADYMPAFRFHKQMLQMLQAENGGRWTLKNPWHPLFLDELTSVYPDAQLVMTHRDPAEIVGSACSLIRHIRPMFSSMVDLREIGEKMIAWLDVMIERQNAFRDDHGEGVIYDIQYQDQLRDPIGSMRKLYAHFDEPFTAEAEAGMKTVLAENPQNKYGKHVYALEEFGLNAENVRWHFRDYCERFDVPTKGAPVRKPLAPTMVRQAERINALAQGREPHAPAPMVAADNASATETTPGKKN